MPRQIFILTCITEALKEGNTDPRVVVNIAVQYGRKRGLTREEVSMCLNWQLMDFTSAT